VFRKQLIDDAYRTGMIDHDVVIIPYLFEVSFLISLLSIFDVWVHES
jgi:hypothetical protein